MGSARDVVGVWCDRLDSWFLSGPAIEIASEISEAVLSKRPSVRLPESDAGTASMLSFSDRFVVELDNEVTMSILRNACSFTVLVSSRWGRDPQSHWDFGQLLMRSAREAYCRGAVLLVADGSAVEPWARRASESTGAKLLRVGFGEQTHHKTPQIWVRCPDGANITRDEGIIMMADRIDAVHVRRGGRIEACLKRRLTPTSERSVSSCSVRVGVTGQPDSAASQLIKAGAAGLSVSQVMDFRELVDDQKQHNGTRSNEADGKRVSVPSILPGLCTTRDWLNEPDRWLVHCTRAPNGPWPGETLNEYRDTILNCERRIANRTVLDALCRIIQSGELTSSAMVSSRRYPVVCWSAVPLLDLLQRRCFRSHVQRWDYEPYGVAVRVRAIRMLGGRPVIYGRSGEADKLPISERFRHQAAGRSIDWREEKEWRLAGSLSLVSLNPHDVRIFALDSGLARSRLVNLPWKVTLLKHLSKRMRKNTGSDGLSQIWKAV